MPEVDPSPDETSVPLRGDEPPTQPMFGRYRLEELIGRGGMGEVYRAFDTVRGRVVALKKLPPALAADPVFQARFRAECALAARLNEPHVVPVHDFGEIDGQLYLDMRLVEGPDLAALLATDGPLSPRRAVEVVAQVAAALDAAHAAGLVHRDIKPGNILLTGSDGEHDFVYVADFGIARIIDSDASGSLTSSGQLVGSADYVAPERFVDGRGDRRVDVYALGCVLHEALTATRPFPVDGLPALINAHLNTPPPAPSRRRPEVPVGIDAVVARAMAKDPADRYASAGALAAEARRALGGVATGLRGAPAVRPVAAGSADATWSVGATTPVDRDATVVVATPVRPVPVASGAADRAGSPPPPSWLVGAGAPRRSGGRRRLVVLAAVLTVVVMAGAVVATQLLTAPATATTATTASDVMTEPYGAMGSDPFMPPVTARPPMPVTPVAAQGVFNGATVGLYGGTLNTAACDRTQTAAFLQGHPDKAQAWADVEGVDVAALPDYLSGLTPVLLRADTAVTNHGFADGKATTLRSVLQAGTAVLVDRYGVPRTRCFCGNPLTAPTAGGSTANYVGERWSGFDPTKLVTVTPNPTALLTLTLVDVTTNVAFLRPVGGDGPTDQPVVGGTGSVPTPTSAPGTGPTPTPGQNAPSN